MNNKILKIIFIVAIIFVISLTAFSFADVGNVNRYTNNNSSSSSSSGISFGSIGIIGIIAIIVIVIIYGKSKGKIKDIKDITDIDKMKSIYTDLKSNISEITNLSTGAMSREEILNKIQMDDPAFSEEKFLSWARDVFIKIQQAWSSRDWKIIRPFESNELFEQHSTQLQEYINNNKINIIEKIAINRSALSSYSVDGDKDMISVNLNATLRDYVVDATTRDVIEGNKDTDWNMRYTMTFTRKHGVKTKEGTSNKSTTNCPNCGAPTQITSAGQCEYCGSVITTGEHDWVLTDITGKNA